MRENDMKDFDIEDPFAGAPGLDPMLEWSEEAYYLVLLSRDASEIERRTDIKSEDWLWAADKFKSEKEYEKAALCLTMAAKTDKTVCKKRGKHEKFELTRKILHHDNSVLVIPEGGTHVVAPIEIEDGIDMYEIAISEIHLPASCEVVDLDSFHDFFYSLKRIVVAPESKYFSSDEDGVLFSADRKRMIKYPANRESDTYRIPDEVEEIATNCFCGTNALKNLYFGKNVKRLSSCSLGNFMLFELDRIFIPPTVTELQHHVFDVVIPDHHLYTPNPDVSEYYYPVGVVGGAHGSAIEEYCKYWNIEFIEWDENDVDGFYAKPLDELRRTAENWG